MLVTQDGQFTWQSPDGHTIHSQRHGRLQIPPKRAKQPNPQPTEQPTEQPTKQPTEQPTEQPKMQC
ncbi:MAG: PT domain-containing protein [Microthrixaceae bacterium]